jgi:hypothetical protein
MPVWAQDACAHVSKVLRARQMRATFTAKHTQHAHSAGGTGGGGRTHPWPACGGPRPPPAHRRVSPDRAIRKGAPTRPSMPRTAPPRASGGPGRLAHVDWDGAQRSCDMAGTMRSQHGSWHGAGASGAPALRQHTCSESDEVDPPAPRLPEAQGRWHDSAQSSARACGDMRAIAGHWHRTHLPGDRQSTPGVS